MCCFLLPKYMNRVAVEKCGFASLILLVAVQHLQGKSHTHKCTDSFRVAADEVQHVLPTTKASMVFALMTHGTAV